MIRAGRMSLRLASLGVGLGLWPTSAAAQSIQTDFDRAFDFSKLKTFAFVSQARRPNDPLAVNPINERRVHAAIDSQLVARGYVEDTSGQPDFLVADHAATRNRVNLQEWGYGPGRWGNRRIDVNEYTEGTLVIDVVDGASKQLVWRGSASGTIAPKEADKKIKKAVAKLVGPIRQRHEGEVICRIWHGSTTSAYADSYEQLLRSEIFQGIAGRRIAGYHGIELLRRPTGDSVEFVTLMWFDTIDAVRAFAGPDYEVAVVPPAARALLQRFDARSTHYDVRHPRGTLTEGPRSTRNQD